MGYSNIIDSLSDKRIDEGMLSKGASNKVVGFLNDIVNGNFSGMTLRDGSYRDTKNKKLYKSKALKEVKKGDATFIDYGKGVLGVLFKGLNIPRIIYYKIQDVPFDKAVDTLVKEYGSTYTNYLSDAKMPIGLIYDSLADVMYDTSKHCGCDENASFDLFIVDWKKTGGDVATVKKLFIDSDFSNMVSINKPLLRIYHWHERDSYSLSISFNIEDYDALKSYSESIKTSLGSHISQSFYGKDEYDISLNLYTTDSRVKNMERW